MATRGLLIYEEDRQVLMQLKPAERGELVTAMLALCFDGVEPANVERARLAIVWPMLRAKIVANQERWASRSEINRENGRKGGRPAKREDGTESTGGTPVSQGEMESTGGSPVSRMPEEGGKVAGEQTEQEQIVTEDKRTVIDGNQKEPNETQKKPSKLNLTKLNKTNTVGTGVPPSSSKQALGWDGEKITGISDEDVKRWGMTYKSVEVLDEIAKANLWLFDNPKRMKKDFRRFLGNWLSDANRKAGDGAGVFGGGTAGGFGRRVAPQPETRRMGETGGNFA